MLKKEIVSLAVEHSVLLDFRRVLFKHNLNPQSFLSFIVQKTVTNDDDMLKLVQEAQEKSIEQSACDKRLKYINADEIYALIENEDQKNNNSDV